jgi:hypothetical protein
MLRPEVLMSFETWFLLVNFGVLPFWLLLACAPRWRGTQAIVHAAGLPSLLGVLYLGALATASWPQGAGGGSLGAMMRLFDSPGLALAAWIHFVAFDLFVGAWQVRDAARHRIRHLAVVPCLALTLFYGPAGLLLYLTVRTVMRRRFGLDEAVPAAAGGDGRAAITAA